MPRRAVLLALCPLVVACKHPATPPATPTTCERARGEWIGEDVDAPDASAGEREVARQMVRGNRWTITGDTFVTHQPGEQLTEVLRVLRGDANQCLVDLAFGATHRQLVLEPTRDGMLRVSGPGMHTAMLFRRVHE